MEIKKSTLYIVGIIFLVFITGFFFFGKGNFSVKGDVVSDIQVLQGETQRVVLSQEGYNYKDVKVQAGKPIEISVDSSVKGCLRSVAFNIGGDKYSKYLQSAEDRLQLPALDKGEYTFSCSMGMGYGKLIVE